MIDSSSELPPGLARQMEIYKAGLAGTVPAQPVSVEELARKAQSVLDVAAYDYVAGGAGSEDTVRAHPAAVRRLRIVPRFPRDVGRRRLLVEVLGLRLPRPLRLAPVRVLRLVPP